VSEQNNSDIKNILKSIMKIDFILFKNLVNILYAIVANFIAGKI